jgi:uncharacterized tellurite resistance protein B-like protein
MVFARLKSLLSASGPVPSHSFQERQLAAAALMVEAATMDSEFETQERARIQQLLQNHFALSDLEATQLLAEAETAAAASVEWHSFTRAIKNGFEPAERIALIEMLWEVAYADGVLHDYEASLLRRITGLIYVSDRDSGEARKRVLARLGLS